VLSQLSTLLSVLSDSPPGRSILALSCLEQPFDVSGDTIKIGENRELTDTQALKLYPHMLEIGSIQENTRQLKSVSPIWRQFVERRLRQWLCVVAVPPLKFTPTEMQRRRAGSGRFEVLMSRKFRD
jgi:hypothetical protein